MLTKTVLSALNEQIMHELYSSYLYLSMSSWAENANLPGFAHWLKVQADEERAHAMKFYDYVLDQGEPVTLLAIAAPPSQFKSPLDIFTQVLAHEKKVTGLIHRLKDLAVKEKDYASQIELDWFVTEQVEEEKNASLILEQLKMIGEKSTGVLMLDHHLRNRGKS